MKAKDIKTTNPKILFYGPAGTGKTGLIAQASGGYMIDADNGMLTAKNLVDNFTKYRQEIEFDTFTDDNPLAPKAWIKIKEKLFDINRKVRAGTWSYDCLVIDSLTMLGVQCMSQVMLQAGKPLDAPQIQHYLTATSDIKMILRMITSLPIMVLAVTHEIPVTVGGEDVCLKPRVIGQKIPDEVVAMFDEVWYTKIKKLPKDQGYADYTVSCLPTTLRDSRTRSGSLKELSLKTLGLRGLLKEMGYTYNHEPKVQENLMPQKL